MDNDDPDFTSNVSDFDIDANTNESWASFTVKLSQALSTLQPGVTLTLGLLGEKGRPPYIRLTCTEKGALLAEAASNRQLPQSFQLGLEQLKLMEQSHWNSPASDGPPPSSAFWHLGTQAQAGELATMAVDALRHVYGVPHPALLSPDELAEILAPSPIEEVPQDERPRFDQDDMVAVQPGNERQLTQLIETDLTEFLGHSPLRDSDGDFAIRVGSTMVFIRASSDALEITVFAALVHDVEGRQRAMEILSDLNTDARYVKFLLVRDRVFASMSVLAHPYVPAHLFQALEIVSVISDRIDNDLAAKLRGHTTFSDSEEE